MNRKVPKKGGGKPLKKTLGCGRTFWIQAGDLQISFEHGEKIKKEAKVTQVPTQAKRFSVSEIYTIFSCYEIFHGRRGEKRLH